MPSSDHRHKATIEILKQYWKEKDSRPNVLEDELLSLVNDPRNGRANALTLLSVFRESTVGVPPQDLYPVPLNDLTDKLIPREAKYFEELMIVTLERTLCCAEELVNPDHIFIYSGDKVFTARGNILGVRMPDAQTVVFQVVRSGYAEESGNHDLRSWDELWALEVATNVFRKILDITWDLGYMQRGSDYSLYSPSRAALGASFEPIDAYYREDYPIPECDPSVMLIFQHDHRSPYFIHKRYAFDALRKRYDLASTTTVDKTDFLVLASQMCGESGRFPSGDSQEVAYRDFLWLDEDPISSVIGVYPQLTEKSKELLERLVQAALPGIGVSQFTSAMMISMRVKLNRELHDYYTKLWCKFNIEGR
jgi:hypothetical protein